MTKKQFEKLRSAMAITKNAQADPREDLASGGGDSLNVKRIPSGMIFRYFVHELGSKSMNKNGIFLHLQ